MKLPNTILTHPKHRSAAGENWRNLWRTSASESADLQSWALQFEQNPHTNALLDIIFGYSPHLSSALGKEFSFFYSLIQNGFESTWLAEICRVKTALAHENDTLRLMDELRISKRRIGLLVAIADITDSWSLELVMSKLSDFADLALQLAIQHLWSQEKAKGKIRNLSASPQGLIILAVGKLGGRELNYSSDIDLVLFYDETVVKGPKPHELPGLFIRLTRQLIRIMSEPTAQGYVFRTDLRLRPDATPVIVSRSSAEVYYTSLGRTWERAVFIKARPVAGDIDAGQQFLDLLRPFLWRYHPDFSALDDIHEIKQRIHAHRGHHIVTIDGHDLKIGRGGIRDIEFIVQTRQLLFGGRQPQLRFPQTIHLLEALTSHHHLTAQAASELTNAYRLLRWLEHRLQMIDDQQTHRLPPNEPELERFAQFCGYHSLKTFRHQLLEHLNLVAQHYSSLFEPNTSATAVNWQALSPDESHQKLQHLGFDNPAKAHELISNWSKGRYRATRSSRARTLINALSYDLVAACSRFPSAQLSLEALDQLLGNLPSGVQFLSLLDNNRPLVAFFIEMIRLSPQLAHYLTQQPQLLASALQNNFLTRLPDASQLKKTLQNQLVDADDFQDKALAWRRWATEQRFQLGVLLLRRLITSEAANRQLLNIATILLNELFDHVQQEFTDRHGRFERSAVVLLGLGDLGSQQMSLHSHLDFMLLYDADEIPLDSLSDGLHPLGLAPYYGRLTTRLLTALTTPTADTGALYQVDITPRPSGSKGPLALHFDSFVRYHDQSSDFAAWDHLLLSQARPVLGDQELAVTLTETIHHILTRPRNPAQQQALLQLAHNLRPPLTEYPHPWRLEVSRALVGAVNNITRYLRLKHAHTYPQLLNVSTPTALYELAQIGLLTSVVAAELSDAYQLGRGLELWLELTAPNAALDLDDQWLSEQLKQAITPLVAPDASQPLPLTQLSEHLRKVNHRVTQLGTELIV